MRRSVYSVALGLLLSHLSFSSSRSFSIGVCSTVHVVPVCFSNSFRMALGDTTNDCTLSALPCDTSGCLSAAATNLPTLWRIQTSQFPVDFHIQVNQYLWYVMFPTYSGMLVNPTFSFPLPTTTAFLEDQSKPPGLSAPGMSRKNMSM